jgi:hypothetical protein
MQKISGFETKMEVLCKVLTLKRKFNENFNSNHKKNANRVHSQINFVQDSVTTRFHRIKGKFQYKKGLNF